MDNKETALNLISDFKAEVKILFNSVNELHVLLSNNNFNGAEKTAFKIKNSLLKFLSLYDAICGALKIIGEMTKLAFENSYNDLKFKNSYSPEEVIFEIITLNIFKNEIFLDFLLKSNNLLNIYLENTSVIDNYFLKTLIGKNLSEKKISILKKIDDNSEAYDMENIKKTMLKFKENYEEFNEFIDDFVLNIDEKEFKITDSDEDVEEATQRLNEHFKDWK